MVLSTSIYGKNKEALALDTTYANVDHADCQGGRTPLGCQSTLERAMRFWNGSADGMWARLVKQRCPHSRWWT